MWNCQLWKHVNNVIQVLNKIKSGIEGKAIKMDLQIVRFLRSMKIF